MADHSDSDSSPKSSSSGSSSGSGERPRSPEVAAAGGSDESGSSDGVLVELPGNADQDSRSMMVDPDSGILVNIDGSTQETVASGSEDATSGETFEDAAEDLGGRASGLDESMAVIEIGESSGSLARIQARLEDAVAECRKYKEEREFFGKEVAGLRRLLQDLVRQQPALAGRIDEALGDDERALSSPTPLHSMLNDCSRFILDLNSVIHCKDQEIEDLDKKNLESSASQESVELTSKRLLASLDSVVGQNGGCLEESDVDVMSLVEKKTSLFVEKYRRFSFEMEQLGQFLAEVKPDFVDTGMLDHSAVLSVARDELVASKRNEADLLHNLNRLEEQNRVLAEEVGKMKQTTEAANAELSKTKAELEQAGHKVAATKEKLSMAVTKGKSLVQQRDSLKQNLAEKTTELEMCTLALQQKTDALQATEARVEELQVLLYEKSKELEKCLDELRQTSAGLETTKASVDELNEKNTILTSLQDSLTQKDGVIQHIETVMSEAAFPEELHSLETVDKISWIVQQKKIADEISVQHNKVKDILGSFDLPNAALVGELDSQISWLVSSLVQTRNNLVKMQDEASFMQVELASHESKLVSLQEEIDSLTMALVEEKREKDVLVNELAELLSQHKDATGKLSAVSSEKNDLIKALADISEIVLDIDEPVESTVIVERSLDSIRQRRRSSPFEAENFEKLQSLLYVRDQELMLCKAILEEEVVDTTERTRLLDELHRMSVEVLNLKNDKESLQKELERVEERSALVREKLSVAVKKGKGLVQEREGLKQSLDEKNSEIENLKHEIELKESAILDFRGQIEHLSSQVKLVENLESEIVTLKDKKEQIERMLDETKSTLQILVGSIESIPLPTDNLFEGTAKRINWIVQHIGESQAAKINVEKELHKVREEAAWHASRLSNAFLTIKTLEDELNKSKEHISFRAEEKQEMLRHCAAIEQELEKTKEEIYASSQKLDDASANIKSLEDAVSQAREIVTLLDVEKKEIEAKHEKERNLLNAKLAECMEELEESRINLHRHLGEKHNHLTQFKKLIMDESLLSLMAEDFGKKISSLRDMSFILHNIHEQFASEKFNIPASFEDPGIAKLSSLPDYGRFITDRMVFKKTGKENLDEGSSFTTIIELLSSQAKFVNDLFKELSTYMDDDIALVLRALQATGNKILHILEHYQSLKLEVDNKEAYKSVQEARLLSQQTVLMALSSACVDATQEIQAVSNDLLHLDYGVKQDGMKSSRVSGSKGGAIGSRDEDIDEHVKVAESLLSTVRRLKIQTEKLANDKEVLVTSLDDLKHKLEQAESTNEAASRDHELYVERVALLEQDLRALQNVCEEMKIKIENFQARDDMLKIREEELLSLERTLTTKERGTTDIFSKGQLEILVEKVNKLNLPLNESTLQGGTITFSSPIDKLFYVIDKVNEFHQRVETLTHENEDMQLSLESHINQVEQLKKATESNDSNYGELELKRSELLETTVGLESIIQRLGYVGGKEKPEDQKPRSTQALLLQLERLAIASNTEFENSKSVMQEMGAKLQAREKMVNELSAKVKLLEDSYHAQLVQQGVSKEGAIFEVSSTAVGSEISEIEDLGPKGKTSTSSIPSAAHARTMRKGSSEHLVVNIGMESEHLIAGQETDNAKGHFFKSLNTSGIIPVQGKYIADRVDSIWVSGSRILMSQPRARLGLVVYWLFLNLWLLGSIL